MATRTQSFKEKRRVFILSDISNEPDDAESLVRYLLYANEFDTEGLVAVTSTWLRNKVYPEDMEAIVNAYGEVVENLNAHVHPLWQYPSAKHLKNLIRKGAETYGMSAVGDEIPLSPGAELLLERIEAPSARPLWILCWGGTNTLAQALLKLDTKHSPEDSARLLSRLRVYAISDQDDTSTWIRNSFPDIFYISSIHGWNQYGLAAWSGISGENYYGFDQGGPDGSKISTEWIKENVQLGALGKTYPDPKFIIEGDTPTFLYLIQNGLGLPDHPDYGSWGGRYVQTDVSSVGLNGRHYSDAVDRVIGADGKTYASNHATIWRWRNAFQNDFAARIQWTLSEDFTKANHHPVITVNDASGIEPLKIDGIAGEQVVLDASKSYDPDKSDKLTFNWFHYREPTATQSNTAAEVSALQIKPLNDNSSKVEVTLPRKEECCFDRLTKQVTGKGQVLHLILEVTDDGAPPLTSYRRILIQALEKKPGPPGPMVPPPGRLRGMEPSAMNLPIRTS